ncbi:DUF3019 domain-containing protein [Pseudoalteromonas sp. MMG022]|uniref:DUF3019 domain-containing protein n=1 Tax=Pseudoalteromonas sp. MMG022 TaxID=2909978 RepID=UPI001F2E6213|nr:DUF3019 domain-containing protein [Pseudoalteromonas sp. MMG022]MCF6435958.1 DUF3019 domain-containing protein [Pseudoalteromonas sp. MMG022]
MYFRLISAKYLLGAILGVIAFDSYGAEHAPSEILHATPNKCVALNQGRTCYADVKFKVNTPTTGDYCIREGYSKKILQCWANTKSFTYTLSFGSAQSLSYELISQAQRDILAVTTIEVNWVHKVQTKKRRWRLF